MRKEYDFTKLKKAKPKYIKHLREAVTLKLDPQVIAYFKKLSKESGLPYQSLINYVLKDYAEQSLRPSANWPNRKGKRVG